MMGFWQEKKKGLWRAIAAVGIGALALAGMTGCGDDGNTPLEGNKNPYAQYANAYKETPFDFNYEWYYVNHVMGGKFNDERAEIEKFRKDPPKEQHYVQDKENGLLDKIRDKVTAYELVDFNTGATYRGETSGGVPDGIGILIKEPSVFDPEGFVKLGHFKDGRLDGYVQTYRAFSDGKTLVDIESGARNAQGKYDYNVKFNVIQPQTLVLLDEGYYKEGRKEGEHIRYDIENQLSRIGHSFQSLLATQRKDRINKQSEGGGMLTSEQEEAFKKAMKSLNDEMNKQQEELGQKYKSKQISQDDFYNERRRLEQENHVKKDKIFEEYNKKKADNKKDSLAKAKQELQDLLISLSKDIDFTVLTYKEGKEDSILAQCKAGNFVRMQNKEGKK